MGADRRRWKIGTLLYLSIGIAYLAVAGVVVVALHFEARKEAFNDAESKARLLLDRNMAIHSYFSTVLKPSLFHITDQHLGKEYFDPKWMSSTYAVREIDNIFKAMSPNDYYYKECAINARSPENEADPFERAFIEGLGRDSKLQYRSGTRVIDGKPFFYVLRRGERMEGGCLRCHSTPSEAPGDLVRRYGPVRSFHRNVGDPVSAISIRVPLAAAYAQANRQSVWVSALLLAILGALFGALAVANRKLFVSPVTALCGKARQIAADEAHLGEMVPVSGGKEIAELMDVFNTMSLSLAFHRERLEERVAERTRELSEANRSLSQEVEDRKRAQEAQGRLGMAVEQAAEAIVITDPQGIIVYINPSFERITGYSREEALGKNPAILKSGRQDDAFYRGLWGTLARGETWSGNFVNRRKDGTLYEEEAVISPVRDASGAVVNYVAVKKDVTRERAMEERLRQSQKMEAVGRLAGGVAHDFNNLLTVINGYSGHLLSSLPEGDPSREKLREIHKAGERAATLTRQLLAYGRKQMLRPRMLDLNAVVDGSVGMLRRLLGEDVEMVFLPGESLRRVRVDQGQVEQILMNLAANARDAMPSGGRMVVETRNAAPDDPVCCRESGAAEPWVVLTVSDTGVGMDEETKAYAFEPFYTTKEVGKGTGLGLSTVYGIVAQSGGSLTVESAPGRGAAFRICLPAPDGEPGPEVDAQPGISPGGRETVLLVEDEGQVRRLLREILAAAGYGVIEARNGEQALSLAAGRPGRIHLLLTDVVMPGIGGKELHEALSAARPGIRVLFISGFAGHASIDRGVLGEGAVLVQKPFRPEELLAKVRDVLDAGG